MSLIIPGGRGDPRREAARNPYRGGEGAHGLTGAQIERMNERFDRMLPQIVSSDQEVARSGLFAEDLAKVGATRSPFRRFGQVVPGGTNPGAGNLISQQTPYQPEFSSPDRQQYPVHRILANRYWRLFHKLDPVIGNCLDMYAETPWSQFQLTGEGVDGEIKEHYERMCEKIELLALLPYIVREFMVVGEAIPHLLYDGDSRMWDYCTLHNPDNIEVIDAPFIRMDPIVELIPDQRLRALLSSGDPLVQKVKAQLPPELLGRLLSRQNLPLDPLNCTFIPRKLHPYDVRGTSIISRLWRVLMLEDAVFSATIATARRHAGPLRIAKMGNPQTGWIPGPEHEKRLLELLAQAELDPLAWIVYHFGVQFEAFGTTDRVISVGREWETLERIKLVGLGVSKGFLSGEVTYASSVTTLQVFLQRLLALRAFFESKWITPKFFRPIAEINEFVKPTQAELSHRIRVRRTAQELEDDARYIIPTLDWDKKLDPTVDRELISAFESLERIGVKISKKTKLAGIGLRYEDEMRASLQEELTEARERKKYEDELGPGQQQGQAGQQPGQQAPGRGQPGGPPALSPPPRPGTQRALPAPQSPPAQQPQQQQAAGPDDPEVQPVRRPMPAPPAESAEPRGNWTKEEIETVVQLFRTGQADDAFFAEAASPRFVQAVERDDYEEAWADLELYLDQQGYPDEDIGSLRRILVLEGVLAGHDEDALRGAFDRLPDEVDDDAHATDAFMRAFSGARARPAPGSGLGARASLSAALLLGDGNAGKSNGKSNGKSAAPGGGGHPNPFRRG